jgi:hypothetical protein
MGHLKSYPTPESFFSDMPPDRIIGEEVEYNIQAPGFSDVSVFIAEKAIKNSGFGLTALGEYLSNGAKVYKDNNLLEYCSPESRGPYQAAAADIAGIQVLAAIVEASGKSHNGLYRISGTALENGVHEERKNTSGAHENFMIPRRIASDPSLESIMASHLASRIWATNGTVTSEGYRFSQKIPGIGAVMQHSFIDAHRTGLGLKPMMLIPSKENDLDVLHDKGWARLEVRFADPLQSLEGQRTNLGATSLTLRLIEQRRRLQKNAYKDRFADIVIKDPLAAAKLFMSDLSLRQTVEVASGKQQNALAIGEQLATMAIELSTMIDLPVDEADSAYTWLETIQALRRSKPMQADYDPFLLKRFDMAAKHHFLARSGSFDAGMDTARGKSLLWDRVFPTGLGQKYWRKLHGEDEEVRRLRNVPPQTRAAVRGAFITKYDNYVLQPNVKWAQYWRSSKDMHYFSDAYGNPIPEE